MAKFNAFSSAPRPSGIETTYAAGGRLIPNRDIADAHKAVDKAFETLTSGRNEVLLKHTVKGSDISKAGKKHLKETVRGVNTSIDQLKYAEGKLGASISGMFRSFGEALGMNTDKMGSTKLKIDMKDSKKLAKNVEALKESSLNIRGNVLERVVSKPFRIAAKYPVPAMIIGALAAVATLGGILGRNAERRTEAEMNAKIADLQQPVAPATANTTVINEQGPVTMDDVAVMEARMKQYGQQPEGGHAAAVRKPAAEHGGHAAAVQASQAAGSPVASL